MSNAVNSPSRPDYHAFPDLLELAKADSALAAEIERLMREDAPLVGVLALRPKRH